MKVLSDIDLNGGKILNATIEGASVTKVVGFDANGNLAAVDAPSGGGDTSALEATIPNAAQFDSANNNIIFKHGDTQLFTLSATAFVKDGMVSNVEISNGNLVVSFNTDAGKQNISIPISDIFDATNYYTKTEIDNAGYLTQDDIADIGGDENVIEAITVNGTAVPVTNKTADISIETSGEDNVIEAITLNGASVPISNKTAVITIDAYEPQQYALTCLNRANTTSKTIKAVEHKCGVTPNVYTYQDGQLVASNISVNSSGDVTVAWNGITTVSAEHPLVICMNGISVNAKNEAVDINDMPWFKITMNKSDVAIGKSDTWADYNITELIIPEEVIVDGVQYTINCVAAVGFQNCSTLTKVVIPDTIKRVGMQAFEGCGNVAEFDMGNGVERVYERAFYGFGWRNITTLELSDNLVQIDGMGFAGMSALTEIIWPDPDPVTYKCKLRVIDGSAFAQSALTYISVPVGVEELKAGALAAMHDCTEYYLPSTLIKVGQNQFNSYQLPQNQYVYISGLDGPGEQWDPNWNRNIMQDGYVTNIEWNY